MDDLKLVRIVCGTVLLALTLAFGFCTVSIMLANDRDFQCVKNGGSPKYERTNGDGTVYLGCQK